MAAFPELIPSTRTYSPGEFPHSVHRVYEGSEARVRHSNTVLGVRLRLFFPAISTADLLTVISHYSGQRGRFLPFAIPDELLSGTDTPADFTPAGHQWRYASKPTVEDISVDGPSPSNLHNLTVELETVPPENTIVAGVRLRARVEFRPGSAQLGQFFDVYTLLDAGAAVPRLDFTATVTLEPGTPFEVVRFDIVATLAAGAVIPDNTGPLTVTATLEAGAAGEPVVDYSTKKLAVLFEGTEGSTTFTDSGANNYTITANNGAEITTSTFAQGSASGNFTRSSGSHLSVASATALNAGTGDFKIAFGCRFRALPTSGQDFAVICALNTFDNTVPRVLFVESAGNITLRLTRPWAGFNLTSSNLSLAINTWYDFEVERVGSTITLRQGTTSIGSGTDASNYNFSAGGTHIGGEGTSRNFDGWLDVLVVE